MITKDNFKDYVGRLNCEEVSQALNGEYDDVACWIGSYGQCNISNIDSRDLDEVDDIISTGGFIADKDTFLQMAQDVGVHIANLLDAMDESEQMPA